MKILLYGLMVWALSCGAPHAQPLFNPCVAYSYSACSPAPSITLEPVSTNRLDVCQGATIYARATLVTNVGQVVVTSISESCDVTTAVADTLYPTKLTNWTVVSWNGLTTTNWGLLATFTATNIGNGSVTFYVAYSTPEPCAGTFTNALTLQLSSSHQPPVITVQPTQTVAAVGQTVTLRVQAAGSPPLSFQWQRNGIPVVDGGRTVGATTSNLVFLGVTTDNAGFYTVEVTNQVGQAVSSRAALTVCHDAGFSDQLLGPWHVPNDTSSHTYNFSSPKVIVGCVIESFLGDMGYWRWCIPPSFGGFLPGRCDVTALGFFDSQELSFHYWDPRDLNPGFPRSSNPYPLIVGQFSARVSLKSQFERPSPVAAQQWTFGLRGGHNWWAYISLIERVYTTVGCEGPPIIQAQPASQSAVRDNAAAFTVTATGSAELQYQWRLNGTDIADATASTYNISSVTDEQLGNYSVQITNSFGAVTSTVATLSFTPPPPLAIWTGPASQSVIQGNSATFNVTAVGTPPLAYRWFHNGGAIANATDSSLLINSAQTADAGSYSVRVTDGTGASVSSSAAILTVIPPESPVIVLQPRSQTGIVGSNVTFTVDATGVPKPTFQWYKGNNPINEATGTSYTLTNIQWADNQVQFHVEVDNGITPSPVTSSNAELTVEQCTPPTITTQPSGGTAAVQSNFSFAVGVHGAPPLACQWRRNGTNIYGATDTTLYLHAVDLFNAGTYSIVITNYFGATTSSDAVLTVTTTFPPGLGRMDELDLPLVNGAYWITLQDLKDHSDATNFTVFKVDQLVSGSLMLNAAPFSTQNCTIDFNTKVIWTPPAAVALPVPAAFRVHVSNGSVESSSPVAVFIARKPKTRLYAWGCNSYGQLGSGQITGQYYDYIKQAVDWQSANSIITRDPRWRFSADTNSPWGMDGCVFPPVPVLGLDNARSLWGNYGSINAVATDGQLWQWGWEDSSFLFGKAVARTDVTDAQRLWYWGRSQGSPHDAPTLAAPSPIRFHTPTRSGVAEVFSGVRDVVGGMVWRVALKDDGTLWSWGYSTGNQVCPYGGLGRSPNEEDDKVDLFWGAFGVSPRQIHIPNDENPGRAVVEIQSSWSAAIARCADSSIWWWGTLGGFYDVERGDGWWEIANVWGRKPDEIWRPVRLTCFDASTNNPAVTQLSVRQSHYLALKQDGTVWEFGYVPRLDPGGIAGLGMCLFMPGSRFPAGEELVNAFSAAPLQVTNGLPTNIRSVAAGGAFGAAVTTNGNVWVWGHLIPNWTNTNPAQISSLSNIVKVVAGWQSLLALDNRGRVWGWGENISDFFCPSAALDWDGQANLYTDAIRVQGIENVTDIFCSENSGSDTAFAIGTPEEGKPTGLTSYSMDQQVRLTWNNYPGASQYLIYRCAIADGQYTYIGPASQNVFLDTNLSNFQTYYYAVSAVVSGAETARSVEVAATPLPPPQEVQSFSVQSNCLGVKLTWSPPANAGDSPPVEYRVERARATNEAYELLASLRPTVLCYRDQTADTAYCYHVIAWNHSGAATNNALFPAGFQPCLPAPTIPLAWNTNTGACAWFADASDSGHDTVTLRWTGPAANGASANWLFQPYEFNQTNDTLSSFIIALSDPWNNLRQSLWSRFTDNEKAVLRDSEQLPANKIAILVQVLNGILTTQTNGLRRSLYTESLFQGVPLSRATTNLLAQSGDASGAELAQLNRLLLDDAFAWSGYFRSGPNWGGGLTGFSLHYSVKTPGGFPARNYQRDASLSALTFHSGLDNDGDRTVTTWEFSWPIPSGAACWASVSAVVDQEQSAVSRLAGPVAAAGAQWDGSLSAVPAYHQIYLEWTDDPAFAAYDVYYTNDVPACTTNLADWIPVPFGANLAVNRFWHTNLTPSLTNYYLVVAHAYDATTSHSQVASAAPTDEASMAPITNAVFYAAASPYDSMVLVEWKAPVAQNDTNPPAASQTGWQFFVERKLATAPGSPYQILTETGFGLAYLDSDVVNGQGYTYRVTAFDQYHNHYTALAVLKDHTPATNTVTPSPSLGLTLLPPTPGNAYVDLTWAPIRAATFAVKHALKPQGPFETLTTLYSTDAYQNAQNTYRHFGAQNGVDHYYYVTAVTPTGRELDSDVKSARPLATLVPLPPAGFNASQVAGGDAGRVLLTWKRRDGAVRYQVFLQAASGALSPLHAGEGTIGTSLLYDIPAETPNVAQLTFAIRSVSQTGLASELKETRFSYTAPEEGQTVPSAGRVKVAGWAGDPTMTMRVLAPTNLTLTLDCSLANVGRVTFLSDGQVLGVAESSPYQITWFQVPAGPHSVSATVQLLDRYSGISGSSPTFNTATTHVQVIVKPELTTYQAAVTDLQLPAPGLPIVLSRSYSSRDATTNTLGVGWQASWLQPGITLSSDLSEGWAGTTVVDWLDRSHYYVADTNSHYVTVTLPGGGQAQFAPRVNSDDLNGAPGDPTSYENDPISANLSFEGFDSTQGTLAGNSGGNIEVGWDQNDESWNGAQLSLQDLSNDSPWYYRTPDGTTYEFSQPGTDNLTWFLSRITDRNSNTLSYLYGTTNQNSPAYDAAAAGKLVCLSNSCGRKVSFLYTNAEIWVYDSVALAAGASSYPVLQYLTTNSQLREVRRLADRSGSYETNRYEYGNTDPQGDTTANTNRLTDVFDPRGVRVLHNQYMPTNEATAGCLASQTDAAGRITAWNFATNTYELILTRTLSSGATNQVQVIHDSSGAVAGVTQPELVAPGGHATNLVAAQFVYDGRGRLTAQTDAAGNSRSYTYDAQDRLVGQSDELGNGASSILNDFGQPTTTTDANGNPTYCSYDDQGNPLVVLDPAGTKTEYAYFSPVVNAGSALPKLLQSETRTVPGVPRLVTEYAYNARGDLQQITEKSIDNHGEAVGKTATTTLQYDANGNRTNEFKTRTDLDSVLHFIRTEYTYDAQNRVTVTTLLEKTGANDYSVVQSNRIAYNAIGKQHTSTDALNRVTQYRYDALGNLVETRFPDDTVTRTAYDENNRPWIVQDKAVPTGSGVTTAPATRTTYDASGRAVRVERLLSATMSRTDASGYSTNTVTSQGNVLTTTRTIYDSLGRVQYSVDARGTVTESVYDAAGRRTNSIVYLNYTAAADTPVDPHSASDPQPAATSFGYDANGNQLWVADALGHATTNVYDPANRVVEVRFPATAEHGVTRRTTAYDSLGRRILETDEAGVSTAYTYDFRGLLTQVALDSTSTNAPRTTYDYDELGNLIAQTDALSRTTRFDYDALGRRTKRVLPDNSTETTLYTHVPEVPGSITNVLCTIATDFANHTIICTNDRMDRLQTKVLPAVSGVAATSISYHYSTVGLLQSVTISGGVNRTTSYSYDNQRRLVYKNAPEGMLTYDYSTCGDIVSLTAYNRPSVDAFPDTPPTHAALSYTYNQLGRLSTVTDGTFESGESTTYHYDAVGNLDYFVYPNGVKHSYTYDERNRLKTLALTNAAAGGLLRSYDYQLDLTGQRTGVAESNLVSGVLTQHRRVAYEYDQSHGTPAVSLPRLHRLTLESLFDANNTAAGTITHQYDPVGNRTNLLVAGITFSPASLAFGDQSFSFNDRDQIALPGIATCDPNGNTVTNETGAATGDLYDAENRLIQRVANGVTIHIGYDHEGNRVWKCVNGVTNYYLLDDRNPSGYVQVIGEYGGPEGDRAYVWGHSLIAQNWNQGATEEPEWAVGSYYGSDAQGSIRQLLDTGGNVTDTYDYDAYGNLLAQTGNTPNNYLYTGQQWDPDLKMQYLRARYYKPDTGRFWTMDTYEGRREDPLSLHKYLYCADNTVNLSDPSGHEGELGGLMMSMSIGTLFFAQISPTTVGASKLATLRSPAPQFHISHGMSDPETDAASDEMVKLYKDFQHFHHFMEAVNAALAAKAALEMAIEEAAKGVLGLRPTQAGEFARDVVTTARGNFNGWNLYTRIVFKTLVTGVIWNSWGSSATLWKPYGAANNAMDMYGKLYDTKFDAMKDAEKAMKQHLNEWRKANAGNISE